MTFWHIFLGRHIPTESSRKFEGLIGVHPIVDDILTYGRTPQERDVNLCNVLKVSGLILINVSSECQKFHFFGHSVSAQGLKPDPSKIEAITKLTMPDSRAKLKTFHGMVNYMAKFAPSLAEVRALL